MQASGIKGCRNGKTILHLILSKKSYLKLLSKTKKHPEKTPDWHQLQLSPYMEEYLGISIFGDDVDWFKELVGETLTVLV